MFIFVPMAACFKISKFSFRSTSTGLKIHTHPRFSWNGITNNAVLSSNSFAFGSVYDVYSKHPIIDKSNLKSTPYHH